MARLPDLDMTDAAANVATAMKAQEDEYGYVFNSTRMLGYCPDIAEAATAMGKAIDGAGNIEPSLRYLIYVRVASLNGCPF